MLEHANRLDALIELLQPMSDPLARAEWGYPTQVAELARRVRVDRRDLPSRARAGQLLADSLARCTGYLAAAALAGAGEDEKQAVLASFRGGVATGDWLRFIQDYKSSDVAGRIPALADVSFKKNGAGEALQDALTLRNRRQHAHGMDDPARLAEYADEIERLAARAIDGLAWLATLDLVYVERCEYVKPDAPYLASGLRLHGAHPAWESASIQVAEPVIPRQVYAFGAGTVEPLALAPLLNVRVCSECGREETYVLERQQANGRLVARSLRDHQMTVGA